MRTWVKGTAPAALLALGVMSMGSGTALADTSGDGSIAGGNQISVPITLPIDISGNAVGVAGGATGSSKGGASVENSGGGSGVQGKTSGNSSILGGNQVTAPITAPVNACGNALSLFGGSEAGCKGGASVKKPGRGGGGGAGGGAGGNRTSGDHSILGGNQVVAPITAPINACGNAVAVLGGSQAGCKGGASVTSPRGGGSGDGAGGNTTSGRSSVLGGNQVVAPITAPINICGNSIAVLGGAFSGCKGGAHVPGEPGRPGGPGWPERPGYHGGHSGHGGHGPRPGSSGNDTDGRFGAGSGNQVIAPINLPINACGNAIGHAKAGCEGSPSVVDTGSGGGAGGNVTSGRSSVLGGNQVVAPVTAPVNVCGNAVAVAGGAFAGCEGGASVVNGGSGRGAGGNVTSGRSSVLGGNQVVAPITAPVNACGNAVAVLGRSEAGCKGGASVTGSRGGGVAGGAGGNTTSGRSSVLGGNQVVAPITAPVNACGNSVAALGDAAAGCLGGSQVGSDGPRRGHWAGIPRRNRTSGLMSALPVVPARNGADGVGGLTGQAGGSTLPALPVVGDVRKMADLPALPALPAAQGRGAKTLLSHGAQAPALSHGVQAPTPSQGGRPPARKAGSALDAVTDLNSAADLDSLTDLNSATDLGSVKGLVSSTPLGGLGLMSAAQPVGVTGMNIGSLFALVLGAMAAASATLFAAGRRIRLAKK